MCNSVNTPVYLFQVIIFYIWRVIVGNVNAQDQIVDMYVLFCILLLAKELMSNKLVKLHRTADCTT